MLKYLKLVSISMLIDLNPKIVEQYAILPSPEPTSTNSVYPNSLEIKAKAKAEKPKSGKMVDKMYRLSCY